MKKDRQGRIDSQTETETDREGNGMTDPKQNKAKQWQKAERAWKDTLEE